jgi:ABC-type glycerol-3-phosphate transport system substrate-binding protein
VDRGAFTLPVLGALVLGTFFASEALTRPPKLDDKIHVTYWEKWTNFEFDAMKHVVDEFNKSQNRIQVDILSVSQIENKTLMAISGRIPPDLAGLYGQNLTQYVDNNAVLPLDDYCRDAGIKKEDYIPVFWNINEVHNHIYSLPTTPASTALHYNRKLFREAGLDPDKPPETIEEMDADVAKITKTDPSGHLTVAGFLHAEPGWWNWCWGPFFGGKLIDDQGRLTINSPENVKAYEWVQSYSKKYGASNLQSFHSGQGNFDSPQNGFMSEHVAMEIQGVWMYNFITKYNPQMDWSVAPFPHPQDRPDLANASVVDLDIICIPRGAKHPKEAFEFLKYVESQKGMEMLCLGQKKLSPLLNVSPEFYAHHPNKYIKLFTELAKGKNTLYPPKLGIWSEYSDEVNAAFDEITLMHKTPKQALDDVVARLQPTLDRYNERNRLRGIQ